MTIDTTTIYEAIRADVGTAWNPAAVYYGHPQTESVAYPYAVIRLDSVPFEAEAARTQEQQYNYEITLVDLWPSAGNIELIKSQRANSLLSLLTASVTYHGYHSPVVHGVDFVEFDDDSEPTFELTIRFSASLTVRAIGD
jgi:hypothetical protein